MNIFAMCLQHTNYAQYAYRSFNNLSQVMKSRQIFFTGGRADQNLMNVELAMKKANHRGLRQERLRQVNKEVKGEICQADTGLGRPLLCLYLPCQSWFHPVRL